MMKKGIKARLTLPKECFDEIGNVIEKFKNYVNSNISGEWEICLAYDKNDELFTLIDIKIVAENKTLVNGKYKLFKEYLKKVTGKQPKQLLRIDLNILY